MTSHSVDAPAAPVGLLRLLPPARMVAEQTPDSRDRVIDAVRAASLFVVVFGHLLMACVWWPADGGGPVVGNLMAAYPALQYLTWVLQVMPFFFAFGAASSVIAWRKADAGDVLYSTWMWGRVRRLLRPVLVYFAIMAVASPILAVVLGPDVEPLLGIIAQPLWFLGVYIVTLLFLPAMWWVHQRSRAVAFVVLIPTAVAISVGTTILGWPAWLGFLNFIFVWLAISQLGFFWHERTSKAAWAVVGLVAFALNIWLVRYGPWPMSLVGLPGDVVDVDAVSLFGREIAVPGWHGEYSNMSPPSVILLLHGITIVSVVFIARGPLERFLRRPRVWVATCMLMLTAMSLYIWHLLAIVGALVLLRALGAPPPTHLNAAGWPEPDSTGGYAFWFAGFLVVFLVLLVVLILLTWSTEHRPLPWWDTPARRALLPEDAPGWLYVAGVVVAGVMTGLGTLVVALVGFRGFPFANAEWGGLSLNTAVALAVLLAGAALLRSLARQPLTPNR